jgi:hypothetical protein
VRGVTGVFVSVELVNRDMVFGGGNVMTSKSVINIAGQSDPSFSPANAPQSCPMMWISDPGCGCFL